MSQNQITLSQQNMSPDSLCDQENEIQRQTVPELPSSPQFKSANESEPLEVGEKEFGNID